jgi:azurin
MITYRSAFAAALLFVAATALRGPVAHAADSGCAVTISASDDILFDHKEIDVPRSCGKAQVTLKNTGSMPIQVMGHNWVLLKKKDVDAFLKDAVSVGPALDYVPANDPRVLAHTKLIAGGETADTTVDLSKLDPAESYTFLCSYPGHGAVMQGAFVVK